MRFVKPIVSVVCFLILCCTTGQLSAQSKTSTNEIYSVVDKMPKFPGGDPELLKHIKTNLIYPQEAKDNLIEGIVFVTFVVANDGKITNPKVVGSVHRLLDTEALRIINSMPDWEPGIHQEKPVSVQYNLPIRFKIKKQK